MAHWTKSFKRYERHFLLGLVILLLASFSVTGAITQCGKSASAERGGLGGSFEVVGQAQRLELSDEEMAKLHQRFTQFLGTISLPTLDFAAYLRQARIPSSTKSAWMHGLLSKVAETSGFRCGPGQLSRAIKAALRRSDRTSSLEVTPETYERFITQIWGRPAADFEQTLREIVVKDELLSSLVDPARFELTYEQAYEAWKAGRERVNLRFLAVEGKQFAEQVRAEETTRRTLSEAEKPLRDLAETVRRLRRVANSLREHKEATGKQVETLATLTAKESQKQTWGLSESAAQDAWGKTFMLDTSGAEPKAFSVGPDGAAGTADDVDAGLLTQLDTHRALGRVAEAVTRWRTGSEPKAWPASLDDLLKPPPRAAGTGPALPPLPTLPTDAWSRPFVYQPDGGAGQAPKLFSMGPDGQAGTADDIAAELGETRTRVGPGPALAAFVPQGLKDVWGRGVELTLRNPEQGIWEAASAGKDGEAGTADDLFPGNRGEIETYYAQASVRSDFLQPMTRRFKALVMHIPLIPEATLKRLWDDYPDLRPGPQDEDAFFLRWQTGRGTGETYEFGTGDPRDPETGHGVALARRMGWPAEATLLVPSRETFAVPPAPPLAPAPAPAPVPEGGAEPPKPVDPLRKEYEERGWREIVLRSEFLERVLFHHWKDVIASREAVKAWEKQGNKVTPRPAELGVEDLLSEERLGKYQPGEAERAKGHRFLEFFATDDVGKDAPAGGGADASGVYLSRQELEARPEFGDVALPIYLGPLKGRDVSPIPIQLNKRLSKVVAQNLDVKPERVPELDEVFDKVFERYLERKQLERAERELAAFQRDAVARVAGRKEGETDDSIWEATLADWKAARPGVAVFDEQTGLFIGSRVPLSAPPPEGATPEAQAAHRRRDFVRQGGYGLVKQGAARGDATDASPGTYGRSLLKDESRGPESTSSAYLVRVSERVYPSKAELSPRAYAEYLSAQVFGERRDRPAGAPMSSVANRAGAMNARVARYFEEFAELQPRFDLKTNRNLDGPPGSR